MSNINSESITKHDAIIIRETYQTNEYSIPGYYSFHTFATPTTARPMRSGYIFIKPSVGTVKEVTKISTQS